MTIAVSFGAQTKQEPYLEALRRACLDFKINPATLDGLGGLMLTGGTDLDPARYHQTPHPETDQPDTERDRRDLSLLEEALQRDIPVLAICRGLQLLNVALGGTLAQHIEGHRRRGERDAHLVQIARGTRLASILKTDDYSVNSRHHQCVDRVGERLTVSAKAADGVIEALELPGKRFALAVQWHPEDRIDGDDCKLFEAFAAAVRSAAATEAAPA